MTKTQYFYQLLQANGVEISENFKKHLKNSGFFTSLILVNYNDTGLLLDHSLRMAETLLTLTQRNNLQWSRPGSPAIIGLFHDLYQMDAYQVDSSGRTYVDYAHQLYSGYGDKSVLMLAPWLSLTEEEVACIYWHAGAFEGDDKWKNYTAAIRQFPNVLWTHHADMIATQIL